MEALEYLVDISPSAKERDIPFFVTVAGFPTLLVKMLWLEPQELHRRIATRFEPRHAAQDVFQEDDDGADDHEPSKK